MTPTLARSLPPALLVLLGVALLAGTARAQTGGVQPRLVTQIGHSGAVQSARFSPDGRFIVTASYDHTARVWDAATGAELRRLEGHGDRVTSATFSPNGRFILTASSDSTARVWDAVTGAELLRLGGDSRRVNAARFSPDGRFIVTANGDRTVRVWDAATGAELRRLDGDGARVYDASFSPDGRLVLTVNEGGTARVRDAETGAELRRFDSQDRYLSAASFSPDGRLVITAGGRDRAARVWDAATGAELRRIEGHTNSTTAASFSPDGRRIVTASYDRTARVWDAATGAELLRLDGTGGEIYDASFGPDGRRVVTANHDGTARVWDAATGAELLRLGGDSRRVRDASFSPDGRFIATASDDQTARVWDAATGTALRRLEGHRGEVFAAAFSADGQRVVTASGDGTARVWDAETGAELLSLDVDGTAVRDAAFSPDGRFIVTASYDPTRGTAQLWDAATGAELRRFEGHTAYLNAASFSPDSRFVATASYDQTARVWDVSTGAELLRLDGEDDGVRAASFSPDGRRIVTATYIGTAHVWDAVTGAELLRLGGEGSALFDASFSPDGRFILTAGADGTARVWDAETGVERRRFDGHTGFLTAAAFSPDGRLIVTASGDGTARIWSAETGETLATLLSFTDGTWAVVDAAGRYDASNGGDVDGLVWVLDTPDGMEPVRLAQLKARYYDPGLLAKVLGFSSEPLRDVGAFRERGLPLYPRVGIGATPDWAVAHLADRGGGIGRVQVLLNGSEVVADARPAGVASDSLAVTVDLRPFRRFFLPDTLNTVEVVAENAEGSLRSRRASATFYVPAGRGIEAGDAGAGEAYAPHLWAVVAGVGDYAGDALDLRFAGKDAADIAAALSVAAERLFTPERTHVALLSTEAGAARPSRAALVAALDSVAVHADSRDVLVVYLAGHGVVWGGQDGDFYFLTADATSGDLADAAVRGAVALSSDSLSAQLARIPALKRVLIFDTCASGRVVELLSTARDVPGAQVRSLDRLKDNTGTFVLAGSAADAVSYETSRFGQGLLTWSLLEGMRLAVDRPDNEVDVFALFDHAQERVPQLARSIGGIQQPQIVMPVGRGSYPIGRVLGQDQARIRLQEPRPVVLRASFQDEATFGDPLFLTRAVNEALTEASYRGQTPPLVFVDAEGYPEAYQLAGRYTNAGGTVRVTARLVRDGAIEATIEATGAAADLAQIAADLVARAEAALATVE